MHFSSPALFFFFFYFETHSLHYSNFYYLFLFFLFVFNSPNSLVCSFVYGEYFSIIPLLLWAHILALDCTINLSTTAHYTFPSSTPHACTLQQHELQWQRQHRFLIMQNHGLVLPFSPHFICLFLVLLYFHILKLCAIFDCQQSTSFFIYPETTQSKGLKSMHCSRRYFRPCPRAHRNHHNLPRWRLTAANNGPDRQHLPVLSFFKYCSFLLFIHSERFKAF